METYKIAVYVTNKGTGFSPDIKAGGMRHNKYHPGYNVVVVEAPDSESAKKLAMDRIRDVILAGAKGINVEYKIPLDPQEER